MPTSSQKSRHEAKKGKKKLVAPADGVADDEIQYEKYHVGPFENGDCFFANVLPQVEQYLGKLTVPQLRVWIADLYDSVASDMAQVLFQSDQLMPKVEELESMMKQRAVVLRRDRYEWGNGLDFMALGLKLDRPIYTYKEEESELPEDVREDRALGLRKESGKGFLFAELKYLRGEPLRLAHEGGMEAENGIHWEIAYPRRSDPPRKGIRDRPPWRKRCKLFAAKSKKRLQLDSVSKQTDEALEEIQEREVPFRSAQEAEALLASSPSAAVRPAVSATAPPRPSATAPPRPEGAAVEGAAGGRAGDQHVGAVNDASSRKELREQPARPPPPPIPKDRPPPQQVEPEQASSLSPEDGPPAPSAGAASGASAAADAQSGEPAKLSKNAKMKARRAAKKVAEEAGAGETLVMVSS